MRTVKGDAAAPVRHYSTLRRSCLHGADKCVHQAEFCMERVLEQRQLQIPTLANLLVLGGGES